jgi:hypothetical protein
LRPVADVIASGADSGPVRGIEVMKQTNLRRRSLSSETTMAGRLLVGGVIGDREPGENDATQQYVRRDRRSGRSGARPGNADVETVGRADGGQTSHGLAKIGRDTKADCLLEGSHAARRRRLTRGVFQGRQPFGQGAGDLAFVWVGWLQVEGQLTHGG